MNFKLSFFLTACNWTLRPIHAQSCKDYWFICCLEDCCYVTSTNANCYWYWPIIGRNRRKTLMSTLCRTSIRDVIWLGEIACVANRAVLLQFHKQHCVVFSVKLNAQFFLNYVTLKLNLTVFSKRLSLFLSFKFPTKYSWIKFV
jgi:hypothetical protein